MSRKSPTYETIKALLARSGNQCAYPECTHPIINQKNKLIAQLCHIEAANEGGERFNPNQNDEDRRDYDNLLFLCYRHHVETNDIEEFTVQRLKQIKYNHEKKFSENPFIVEANTILRIKEDFERYWNEVKYLHENHHRVEPVKMEIDIKASFFDKIDELKKLVEWIEDRLSDYSKSDENLKNEIVTLLKEYDKEANWLIQMPYYENPFDNRNWEFHNLGVPNFSQKVEIALCQLEIKYLEIFLRNNPKDKKANKRMNLRKEEFKYLAQNSGYYD